MPLTVHQNINVGDYLRCGQMSKAKKLTTEEIETTKKDNFDFRMKQAIINRTKDILSKPRTTAHTPVALVEIVYALLSIAYENRFYERYMNDQYSGPRAWYMMDDVDYPIAVNRLQKLVSYLEDELS